MQRKYIYIYFVFIIIFIIIYLLYNFFPGLFPVKNSIFKNITGSHYILHEFPVLLPQENNMCAGYSVAYALNYYGIDIGGKDSYLDMKFNLPYNMGIPPSRLIKYLNKMGIKTSIYKGDITNIVSHVAQNDPVIVLVGEGWKWQHYMVLVGYNLEKKELYFYDPERSLTPLNRLYSGNRKISIDQFKKMWANKVPLYNHIYIPIIKN
ncbi:MAG: C39 family peptidase [Bacillota bacterium]